MMRNPQAEAVLLRSAYDLIQSLLSRGAFLNQTERRALGYIKASLSKSEVEAMGMREQAIAKARAWLAQGPVFFDTETTGFDGEIVEICVLDSAGAVLVDTLLRPRGVVEEGARAVHGITDEMLRDAPTLADVEADLRRLLCGSLAVAYNFKFDGARVGTSLKAYALEGWDEQLRKVHGRDAMGLYSEFRLRTRWTTLGEAARECALVLPPTLHRARADAELCRLLVHHVASGEGMGGLGV